MTTEKATPSGASLRYMPALDGLRAVAVATILLFHFDRSLLAGGYVGVDIFYVISGFLIALILLGQVDGGRMSLLAFYQRRIARIFPLFALVMIATIVVAGLVYQSRDFGDLGHDVTATAALIANVYYAVRVTYLAPAVDTQPLLHYWSLAVEEQFYLLFPAYILIVTRWCRRPLLPTAILALFGFGLGIAMTYVDADYAFYWLPPRVWEFLAGACIAMLARQGGSPGVRGGAVAMWGGVALLVTGMLVAGAYGPFPGWIVGFTVIGTALLLLPITDTRLLLVRVLGSTPFVWVGKRSYALYLWHWPVFSMVDYHCYAASGAARGALKVALTLVLTIAAHALVERPFREWLGAPRRRWIAFGGFVAISGALCLTGLWIARANLIDATPDTIASGGVRFAGRGRGSVMLLGDSMASMYAHELADLGERRGFALDVVSISGGNEMPGMPLWPSVRAAVQKLHPDVIVIGNRWTGKLKGSPRGLDEILAELSPYAKRIILIGQTPAQPDGALRAGFRSGARPPFVEQPTYHRLRLKAEAVVRARAGGNVLFVPIEQWFVRPDGTLRLFAPDGALLYANTTHLADPGARLVVSSLDRPIMDAIREHR